jgi:hypothetical protein
MSDNRISTQPPVRKQSQSTLSWIAETKLESGWRNPAFLLDEKRAIIVTRDSGGPLPLLRGAAFAEKLQETVSVSHCTENYFSRETNNIQHHATSARWQTAWR